MDSLGFGAQLNAALLQVGMARKELAQSLSVDCSLVGKWVRGERLPTADNLQQLVKLMVSERRAISPHQAADWVQLVRPNIDRDSVIGWGQAETARPRPPSLSYWVARPSYAYLVDQLLERNDQADQALVLVGPAGVGKTTMLQALVHDPSIRWRYQEVLLIEAGPSGSPARLMDEIAVRLGWAEPLGLETDARLARFAGELATHDCLLLIDDIWTPETLEAALALAGRCRMVLATRNEDLIGPSPGLRARVSVETMTSTEGTMLLRNYLGLAWQDGMDASAVEAVQLVEGLPLALVIVASQVLDDGWQRWIQWLADPHERLARLRLPGQTDRYSSVSQAIQVGYAALDEAHQQALLAASALPNPVSPEEVAGRLRIPCLDAHYRLKLLARRSFLTMDAQGICMPLLVRDFAGFAGS